MTNTYRPDYAVPTGWILEEYLEIHNISHAEFALRCGLSASFISNIIAGKALEQRSVCTPVALLVLEILDVVSLRSDTKSILPPRS